MKPLAVKPGDWVVFSKQKASTSPGPRAKDVSPAAKGEGYVYRVEKYWVVEERLANGQLKLRTRRGKQHVVSADDIRLRRARWWEKWLFGDRFRAAEHAAGEPSSASNLSEGARTSKGIT